MKHALELFEQPIPVLRLPVPEDAEKLSTITPQTGQDLAGDLIGELAEFDCYRKTSVVAELDGQPVGVALAYIPPYDPETLFIWQLTLAEHEQDKGLASLMLGQLIRREACVGVTRVQTTISADNEPAWSLFRRFARWQRSRLDIRPFITQALDPHRRHEGENMVTIQLNGTKAQAA